MNTVTPGRRTSATADEVTVFLIGMRVNTIYRPDAYVPVARDFLRMVAHLESHPESGFLGQEMWLGRTTIALQYWRSAAELQRFASDGEAPHLGPWRAFTKRARAGHVGVWHETYVAPAGNRESIYFHMPTFGLGKALGTQEIGGATATAARRMRAGAAAHAETTGACPVAHDGPTD